jgi:hypothetical protein
MIFVGRIYIKYIENNIFTNGLDLAVVFFVKNEVHMF